MNRRSERTANMTPSKTIETERKKGCKAKDGTTKCKRANERKKNHTPAKKE